MHFILLVVLFLSSCLKTRSEVTPNEQSYLSRKKAVETQSVETSKIQAQQSVDQEELIRALNGKVEVLENQVSQLKVEVEQNQKLNDVQKINILQEAVSKMELQIQKLEAQQVAPIRENAPSLISSDDKLNLKKSTFDIAEDYFAKKEWKKSILSYQKFVEEFPKSKLVPDAKYKTGVCFQELGLKDEAIAFYEETIVQYPQTTAGKKSKVRLNSLNGASANQTKPKKK